MIKKEGLIGGGGGGERRRLRRRAIEHSVHGGALKERERRVDAPIHVHARHHAVTANLDVRTL